METTTDPLKEEEEEVPVNQAEKPITETMLFLQLQAFQSQDFYEMPFAELLPDHSDHSVKEEVLPKKL